MDNKSKFYALYRFNDGTSSKIEIDKDGVTEADMRNLRNVMKSEYRTKAKVEKLETVLIETTIIDEDCNYSMSNFEQTKARIHRVGQKENCTYIYLTTKGTVDEKVLQALQDKANLAKTLVDDYRNGFNPFTVKG